MPYNKRQIVTYFISNTANPRFFGPSVHRTKGRLSRVSDKGGTDDRGLTVHELILFHFIHVLFVENKISKTQKNNFGIKKQTSNVIDTSIKRNNTCLMLTLYT